MSMPAPGTTNPLDGSALPPVTDTPADAVPGLVDAARAAQSGWAALDVAARSKAVLAFARAALERSDEIIAILASETGRSPLECALNEANGILDYAKGAVGVAKTALKPEKVPFSPIVFPGKRAVIEPVARGVVGIIAPWNYPLGNFYKSLFPALLSGNGVVMKPSEHTPRSGAWLAGVAADTLPAGLVQLAQGGGDVGAAVVDAVDAVVFTGSVATGRKIASRAGGRLIPCSVELGGKDAAIVLADCDLARTVAGIAQWGMHNAGQNCAGLERVYVEDAIADTFIPALARAVGRLRVESGTGESELGPLQNAQQLAVVEAHVADARAQGATVLCGGERVGSGLGYAATVIDGCAPGMLVHDEETFGPVLAVVRVPDADAGVVAANASQYGLNGSVWTTDLARGERLARQLDVGIANVNNHSFAGIVPQIPWTGVKETGHGVAASRHSYGTFVRPRTVLVDKNKAPDPFWFPANPDLETLASAVRDLSLGAFAAIFRLLPVLGKRTKAIRDLSRED